MELQISFFEKMKAKENSFFLCSERLKNLYRRRNEAIDSIDGRNLMKKKFDRILIKRNIG